MNLLLEEWMMPDLEKRIESVVPAEMGKATAAVMFKRYDNKTGQISGGVGYSVTAENLDDLEKSLKASIAMLQSRLDAITVIRTRCKV
jgi:hypothetical protein